MHLHRLLLTAGLFTLLFSTPLPAQDEPEPDTDDEPELTLEQAKEKFTEADRKLNAVWGELKKKLPEQEFVALKVEQRAWIEHRHQIAATSDYTGVPPEESAEKRTAPQYFSSAADLSDSRTEWLRALIAEPEEDESVGLTGWWTDSYGGYLRIAQEGNQLYFDLDVVRGPTSHSGRLLGIAQWNKPIGWFSDKGRDEDKEDETNISFRLQGNKLQVTGANTGHYHGARAYFDGNYVKSGPLHDEAKPELMKNAKKGEIEDP